MWDVTVGGHVDAGEFGRQSLIREVKEELGIDITDDDIKYLVGSSSINIKGDNILTYLTAFLASFIGIAFSIFKKKK